MNRTSAASTWLAAVFAAALDAQAPATGAQTPASPPVAKNAAPVAPAVPNEAAATPDVPATRPLHSIWLAEVLDLDHARAAADYERLANDARTPAKERWLAAARLTELQRLGAAPDTHPIALNEVPDTLRPRFQDFLGERPDVSRAAAIVRDTPPERWIAALRATVPALRPLVREAYDWTLDHIDRDRAQQWRQLQQRRSPGGRLDLVHALNIVALELDDDGKRAEANRSLFFFQWQAPPAGDPAMAMATALHNLEEWRRERGSSQFRTTLTRLGERLQRLASRDPAEAVRLLQRLPLVSERLLTGQFPQGR